MGPTELHAGRVGPTTTAPMTTEDALRPVPPWLRGVHPVSPALPCPQAGEWSTSLSTWRGALHGTLSGSAHEDVEGASVGEAQQRAPQVVHRFCLSLPLGLALRGSGPAGVH